MRRVYLTDAPYPASPDVIAQATAAGADEIIHCDDSGAFPEPIQRLDINTLGYHEIADPPDPVPTPVSRMQAMLALHDAGLLTAVKAIIAHADTRTRLAWEATPDFHRTSPAIAAIWAALGKTEADLDDLFRAASLIEV